MRGMNRKNTIVKVDHTEKKKSDEDEDAFHLDDDVTKDYLKGKIQSQCLRIDMKRKQRKRNVNTLKLYSSTHLDAYIYSFFCYLLNDSFWIMILFQGS